ncbi:putative transposase, partial [Escherichia coli EC1846]
IVCPEFRASMEAQMNHESVWNIEPVTLSFDIQRG